MEAAGRLLSIREVAALLGMAEGQLRELARLGKLPATKQAGRWLVESAGVENVRPLRSLGPKRVRGRLAEGVALDDLTHRLLHKGPVASDPRRRGHQPAALAAESEAIEHQLHPGRLGETATPLPPGLKGRARAAQGKALEHMEERLDKPHPPERSL
ncbi:MAG TPA: helix-turn-helix domain-containing protein [Chloroflexota bacterium]|nr:helix-turn-helix domain-containing protein [Chloroflexota bacterium]